MLSPEKKGAERIGYFSIDYSPPCHTTVERIFFPDVDDYVPNKIRKDKSFYESDLLEHLLLCVPTGGVIIDVGANIGNHTLFFSKFMASRVVAIEPHPATFRLLNSTVTRNQLQNVVCIDTAVGSAKGRATLALPHGFEGNTGSFRITQGDCGEHAVHVPVDTLDAMLPERLQGREREITLVKVDVEGYEQQVLRGAQVILRTAKPHLAIESQSSNQLKRIIADLRPLGYRCIGRFCATPTYHLAPCSFLRSFYWRLRTKFGAIRRRSCHRLS